MDIREMIEKDMDEALDELENDEDFQKRQEEAVREAEEVLGGNLKGYLDIYEKAGIILEHISNADMQEDETVEDMMLRAIAEGLKEVEVLEEMELAS